MFERSEFLNFPQKRALHRLPAKRAGARVAWALRRSGGRCQYNGRALTPNRCCGRGRKTADQGCDSFTKAATLAALPNPQQAAINALARSAPNTGSTKLWNLPSSIASVNGF
jgi:hypothetical protein